MQFEFEAWHRPLMLEKPKKNHGRVFFGAIAELTYLVDRAGWMPIDYSKEIFEYVNQSNLNNIVTS
jgi:hypothetical protein